ncbi:hypothetical protein DMUE_4261 [Dictyocoela muelleri]|nr:hypothetical protein DMUE_4261 [Dictyocoela muelleri]
MQAILTEMLNGVIIQSVKIIKSILALESFHFSEGFSIDMKFNLKVIVLKLSGGGLDNIENFFDNKKKNEIKIIFKKFYCAITVADLNMRDFVVWGLLFKSMKL